jgi:predicted dinucleotide-binding enzyme
MRKWEIVVDIAIIGTGFIGTTLGRSLATAGHEVTFGSRSPHADTAPDMPGTVTSIDAALARSEVVILAIPGAGVAGLTAEH